ncbi:protein disulfide-isomerase A2 isoform X2 [Tachyglossus aculeatus]|uniref:protein disulfide-isomerase A2 isoform X2 n=1 Tax=Tachyglossus aculeatus TaxID=9261 RepID=UPI0018F35DEB|nr:protein disulfide-isomerase A2 isoform X2 [Tachyglossus aculeatus]
MHRPRWLLLLLLLLTLVGVPAPGGAGEEAVGTGGPLADEEANGPGSPPADEVLEEGDILVLHRHNFDRALRAHPYLLVEFYAPGCGHCQALAPEFSKAAALLKNVSSELRLAKVDGVVEKELSEEFAVGSFPALKLFKLGNRSDPVDYSGRREAGAIVRWLLRKAGPSTTLLEDEATAARFIDSQDPVIVVVGFFSDLQSDNAAVVTTIAEDAVDFSFGLTDRPELFQKYGVSRDTVVLFKKFDEGRVDFPVDGDLDLEEFSQFLLSHSLELVMEYNSQTSSKIFEAKVLNHMLLFVNQTLDSHRALRPAFYEAAAPFRGQVLFVVLDVAGDNNHVLQYFGMNATAVPTLRFINVETTRKYMPQPGPVTASSVTAFCQDVLGGKIKHYLKSQEIPPDWDQRPVKVLVGKNFEQVAFDETKNVFVKFYAPWCTHCQEMAQVWEELAGKYQEDEGLLIAELDSTANELEAFPISGFPTLKYFPAGPGRKVVEYKGARDLEAFSKFLDSGGVLPTEEPKPSEMGTNSSDGSKDEL